MEVKEHPDAIAQKQSSVWPWFAFWVVAMLIVAGVGLLAGVAENAPPVFWIRTLLLAVALPTLIWTDLRAFRLPDAITLPLILAGLMLSIFDGRGGVLLSIAGALTGYAMIWLLHAVYLRLRGRSGIGLGDAKLIAAGGAFFGAFALAPILLVSSFTGILSALVKYFISGGRQKFSGIVIAFGPSIAFAIWATNWAFPRISFSF